jgi:hypothetical protein
MKAKTLAGLGLSHERSANQNMKTAQKSILSLGISLKLTTVVMAVLLFAANLTQAGTKEVVIVPPSAKYHGKTYGEWAAAFWQYAFALPLEVHPFLDTPEYNFSAGQSGAVWFWSSPDGPITRTVTLPEGKGLFLTIRDVDTSTLEEAPFYGATEADQRANSKWFADHIVNVFCVIDGVPVSNLQNYRFSTPQFECTAPTPWIFGTTGGVGRAVGDGYFLMLDLPKGSHTIHYGGTFRFAAGELIDVPLDLPHDVTIQVTVVGN